jgi:hypothetical protein
MMTANNKISHYPTESWSCYSTTGATGAQTSNLVLGTHSTPALTALMMDDGGGNEPVGHRRWILHSTKTSFGVGSTANAMAMHVFGAVGNTKIPSFIAYPPKGFFPQQLVCNRWSFSVPGADFSAATVSVQGPSGSLTTNVVSRTANGYGDNTIVFVPSGVDKYNSADINYTVTVGGVKNAPQSSYTYTVIVIKP